MDTMPSDLREPVGRGVCADWLGERGDPREEYLRLRDMPVEEGDLAAQVRRQQRMYTIARMCKASHEKRQKHPIKTVTRLNYFQTMAAMAAVAASFCEAVAMAAIAKWEAANRPEDGASADEVLIVSNIKDICTVGLAIARTAPWDPQWARWGGKINWLPRHGTDGWLATMWQQMDRLNVRLQSHRSHEWWHHAWATGIPFRAALGVADMFRQAAWTANKLGVITQLRQDQWGIGHKCNWFRHSVDEFLVHHDPAVHRSAYGNVPVTGVDFLSTRILCDYALFNFYLDEDFDPRVWPACPIEWAELKEQPERNPIIFVGTANVEDWSPTGRRNASRDPPLQNL